jgi:hypothetical protein
MGNFIPEYYINGLHPILTISTSGMNAMSSGHYPFSTAVRQENTPEASVTLALNQRRDTSSF